MSSLLLIIHIHEHLLPAWIADTRDKALALARVKVREYILNVCALIVGVEFRPF